MQDGLTIVKVVEGGKISNFKLNFVLAVYVFLIIKEYLSFLIVISWLNRLIKNIWKTDHWINANKAGIFEGSFSWGGGSV